MARGAIKCVSINGALTVTFTAASGATPTVFSDEACTSTTSLPATVADGANTTFYFASPGSYTLSVKTASGVQIAGDLNTTKVVTVAAGDVGVYAYDTRLVSRDASGDSGRHSPNTDLAATYVAQTSLGLVVSPSGDTTGVTDVASVHAARDAAGVGGRLIFGPGTFYGSFVPNQAGQTWDLHPGATLKAPAGATASVIISGAAGVRVVGSGTIDGNRANVSSSVAGVFIQSAAHSGWRVTGLTFQHIAGYGVQSVASRTKVHGCDFSDIAAEAILIQSSTADIFDGEAINNTVDKSTEAAATVFAGIHMAGGGGHKHYRAKSRGNTVLMPASPTNSTGLAICVVHDGGVPYSVVKGNTTSGGAMGVSLGAADGSVASGNTIVGPNWYGVEIADSPDVAVVGNTIDGNNVLGGGWDGNQSTAAIVTDGAGSLSSNATIQGNTVRNLAASNGSKCVELTSGTGWSVVGNILVAAVHGIISGSTGTGSITGNRITGQSLTNSVGIDVSGQTSTAGNEVEGFDKGIRLSKNTGTLDNVTVTGNTLRNVTTPIDTNLTGGAAMGTSVQVDTNAGTRSRVPNFPHVVDVATASSSTGFTANRVYYMRSRGSGLVSSIGLSVGTASGNMRVGIYRGSGGGRTAIPAARVADSGSVVVPAAGYQTVALGSTVWVNAGDYFAIVVDNGTATILGLALGAGGSAITAPYAYSEDPGSLTLPATATPNVGQQNIYRLVGV